MEVRQMATVFLINQEHVLMMKKARSKIFSFAFWGGIGGHLEYEELNFPMKASYREIEDNSTFILERQNNFIPSDEGELFWIHKNELLNIKTSKAIRFTIQHCLDNPAQTDICVGTVTVNNEQVPHIQWSPVKQTSTF